MDQPVQFYMHNFNYVWDASDLKYCYLQSWNVTICLFHLELEFHVLLWQLDDLFLQHVFSLSQFTVLNTSVLLTNILLLSPTASAFTIKKLPHQSTCQILKKNLFTASEISKHYPNNKKIISTISEIPTCEMPDDCWEATACSRRSSLSDRNLLRSWTSSIAASWPTSNCLRSPATLYTEIMPH